MKFLGWKTLQNIAGVVVFTATALWFILSNFPTMAEQEKSISAVKDQLNFKISAQQESLNDIKHTLRRIDQRVYDIHRRNYGTR
jgi:uncharacterized coiled-coil protein SlyX